MTGIDIFALLVLLVIVATVLWLLLFLARWPGKIADERNHRHSDAVRVAGWVGVVTFGIIYPLALIWAYATPDPEAGE